MGLLGRQIKSWGYALAQRAFRPYSPTVQCTYMSEPVRTLAWEVFHTGGSVFSEAGRARSIADIDCLFKIDFIIVADCGMLSTKISH